MAQDEGQRQELLQRPDVVILGCGISGLVVARILSRQGLQVMLIDQYPEAGGNHISKTMEGMSFDIGAIHFNSEDIVFDHFPELKARCVEARITTQKLSADLRIRRYPLEASDLLDRGLWFAMRTFASLVRGRLTRRPVANAGDYVERRIGSFFFEKSGLRNYVERLFGCDPAEIDAEFGERRLGWLTRRSSLRHGLQRARALLRSKPATRATTSPSSLLRPAEGFADYYRSAVTTLRRDGVNVQLGVTLASIGRENGRMRLATSIGAVSAARLISTLPLRLTSALAGLTPPDLKSVDLMSLFVAYRGPRTFSGGVLFNFHDRGDWKRLTMFSDFYGRQHGWDYFTAEIPIRDDQLDGELLYGRFAQDIAAAGLFSGPLRLVGHHRLGEAYPLLDRGCGARRAAAIELLQGAGIECIGRQGRFEYIPHQNVACREAAALVGIPNRSVVGPPAATPAAPMAPSQLAPAAE